MPLIIIAGMPATGKSTLAKKLAAALRFPILEKDEIKEALFDTVGYRDLTEKRALDLAANKVLLRCTESLLISGTSLIAVNNFDANMSDAVQSMLERCNTKCVLIFCDGDPEVLYARYVARDKAKTRHQGHTFIDRYPPQPGDDTERSMTREYFRDRFEKNGMAEFRLDCPRIDVDATHPEKIDADALLQQIMHYIKEID